MSRLLSIRLLFTALVVFAICGQARAGDGDCSGVDLLDVAIVIAVFMLGVKIGICVDDLMRGKGGGQ